MSTHDVTEIVARNKLTGIHKVNCNNVSVGMDGVSETYYTIDVDENGIQTSKGYVWDRVAEAWVPMQQSNYDFSGVGRIIVFIRGTSVQSLPVGSNRVLVMSNIDCNVAWGANPVATTSSTILQSRQPYILTVGVGNKIAILPITLTAIPTTYFYINELL